MVADGWRNSGPGARLSGFDAVIFDLDGVVTKTAQVHASAWKDSLDRVRAAHGATRVVRDLGELEAA